MPFQYDDTVDLSKRVKWINTKDKDRVYWVDYAKYMQYDGRNRTWIGCDGDRAFRIPHATIEDHILQFADYHQAIAQVRTCAYWVAMGF